MQPSVHEWQLGAAPVLNGGLHDFGRLQIQRFVVGVLLSFPRAARHAEDILRDGDNCWTVFTILLVSIHEFPQNYRESCDL